MPEKEHITLFDTTLRDGNQTPGIDFTLSEKIQIAALLDDLGIDYVEGGYPGANATDTELFDKKRTKTARFTAFGMTKRAGVSVSNDPGLQGLLQAKADAICFVGKSWDYHVRLALGISLEENIESIRHSIRAVLESGREPMLDCEHFFDGYKANPEFALSCAKAAYEEGARWIVLCDTNGGTLPHEVSAIVAEVCKDIPGDRVGIHAHDDTGQAVANSLAAVRAGARQIQGTLNGIGERCGNANLVSIIPTLALKPEFSSRFDISVAPEKLQGLTRLSNEFDEILNRAPRDQAPYVGRSAFATKAGIHASALAKEPKTYEHVDPDSVGNRRRILVSEQAGKSNLLSELKRAGIEVDPKDPRLTTLLSLVKERESLGYAYDNAAASFELLARRTFGTIPSFFDIKGYRVNVERRFNAIGELVTVSEAVVRVEVKGEELMSVAEGIGPVNALDRALRKDLGIYQEKIADLELVDYKVRILNGGTEAVTRVAIESLDRSLNERWQTVGVSANIVDASFQALSDSIIYRLLRT